MKKQLKKLQIKGFATGMLVMFLMSGVTVWAASRTQNINVTFSGIRVNVNGEVVTPRDATGNAVEPFVWDGTTYLPVRAVADALGVNVRWDGNTSTVYLTGNTPNTGTGAPATQQPATQNQNQSLVGTWNWIGSPWYVFNADGTGVQSPNFMEQNFRWSTNNGVLTITGMGMAQEWDYVIEGNQLTITSRQLAGLSYTYTRQ